MSYKGYRYGVQYTNHGGYPVYWVTDRYRTYLHSLPPEQSIPLMEKTLDDINNKKVMYYAAHNWQRPTLYTLSSLSSSRPPYSEKTHRPHYYI